VLDELCIALQDLDNGKVDARLKAGKGKRQHGVALRNTKIELLAAVNARAAQLKEDGVENYKQQARKDVANTANALGYSRPEGRGVLRRITETLLKSWDARQRD
jgi:citrate lyase gamma subunit